MSGLRAFTGAVIRAARCGRVGWLGTSEASPQWRPGADAPVVLRELRAWGQVIRLAEATGTTFASGDLVFGGTE